VERGLLRGIGVSNFDVPQLQAAQAALRRERLRSNQVLYHLGDRGVAKSVLPFCEGARIAVVGHTPRARVGFLRGVVAEIARKHGWYGVERARPMGNLTRRLPESARGGSSARWPGRSFESVRKGFAPHELAGHDQLHHLGRAVADLKADQVPQALLERQLVGVAVVPVQQR
jgi:Aldo/keto reductase family